MIRLDQLPQRVALIYLLVSSAWVFGSDYLVYLLADQQQHLIQSVKGWGFIVSTSVMFFYLLKHPCDAAQVLQDDLNFAAYELQCSNQKKQLLIDTTPLSIWELDLSEVKRHLDRALTSKNLNLTDWMQITPIEFYNLFNKINVISVNQTSIDIFGAKSKEHLISRMGELFNSQNFENFYENINHFYRGEIDKFKNINDCLGFNAGDSILKLIPQRLTSILLDTDTIARISADEFAVLLEDVEHTEHLAIIAEKIMQHLYHPFAIDGHAIHISVSAGIGVYPDDGNDFQLLLRNTDSALSRAKAIGPNNYRFYTEEFTLEAREYLFIENSLRSGILNNEFKLVYQPQIDFNTQQLIGMEALIRWHHPTQGIIPPNRFIPIAEQSGLIKEIGDWVLQEAFSQTQCWIDAGYEPGRIAINIAGPQIKSGTLIETLKDLLSQTKLSPTHFTLEITESFIMDEPETNVAQLNAFRNLGFELAIDDFGTGYSSLNYLKKLPINKLKIDQSFVSEIENSNDDLAIVDAIISLANALGISTVAEGVETQKQALLLTQKGCQQAQGYLYSKPVYSNEIEEMFLIPMAKQSNII